MSRRIVAVADPIHADGLERLRQRHDVVFLPDFPTPQQKLNALQDAEAIVVRTFRVDQAVLDRARKLRLIAKHGAGLDNVDIPAATKHRVLVANTPGGSNASGVAEGAVALMLAVLRQVTSMDKCVREGRFNDRWSVGLHQLWGKAVGLIGFGQIARLVARVCSAGFDATVLSYDPFVASAEMAAVGVVKVDDLIELAARSDVLSVHVPLSDKTRHVVGREVIAALKGNAIIVNTSRGGIVDEAALIEALRSGKIAGAGIDVFEKEPPDRDNPLFSLGNVILSPHVAGATDAGLRDMAMKVVGLIDDTFAGRRPETLVNAAAWESRSA